MIEIRAAMISVVEFHRNRWIRLAQNSKISSVSTTVCLGRDLSYRSEIEGVFRLPW